MSNLIIPRPEWGKDSEETIRNLFDSYYKLAKIVENFADGNISYENLNLPDFNDKGIDPIKFDPFRNNFKNSQFEKYDTALKPWGYSVTNGTISADANYAGTVSLKLNATNGVMLNDITTNKINPTYWSSKKTRLTFWKKFGKVKVEIIDDNILGNSLIMFKEFDYNQNWDENSRCTLTFDPGKSNSILVKISNIDESTEAYIDCVHISPDTTEYPVIYKDGANSIPVRDIDGYIDNLHENTANSGITIDEKILIKDGAITGQEVTEPDAPTANKFVLFAVDNAGKTELKVKFNTGASQVIATEP